MSDGLKHRFALETPEQVFFCWAGAEHRGAPHYYRIQTSRFAIEFVNTIDDGNHIHSAIREFDYDFGHDLLAHHRAQEELTGYNLNRRLASTVP